MHLSTTTQNGNQMEKESTSNEKHQTDEEIADYDSPSLIPEHLTEPADPGPALEQHPTPPQPHCSSHVPILTAKADLEGEHVKTARASQRGAGHDDVVVGHPPQLNQAPDVVDQEIGDSTANPAIPDLANIVTIKHLDQLLAAVEDLSENSNALELTGEPRSWQEAKQSGDSKKWEMVYREELDSLKQMGVYQLIP
ncbi:hypothetical protein C0995_004047 [Termitomyces sp. Mi166|nr:hypothetical protein C0995_004047 [Termitomyces sp. Mi166\